MNIELVKEIAGHGDTATVARGPAVDIVARAQSLGPGRHYVSPDDDRNPAPCEHFELADGDRGRTITGPEDADRGPWRSRTGTIQEACERLRQRCEGDG